MGLYLWRILFFYRTFLKVVIINKEEILILKIPVQKFDNNAHKPYHNTIQQ